MTESSPLDPSGGEHAARRILGMAFLATLLSAFGQTFLIGLFTGTWREEFGLSHAGMGSLYSGATLISGLTMVKVGRGIDRMSLPRYTALVVLAFALGCAVTASAWGPASLGIGIFLIRQCGQGLMGHIAITTIARTFTAARGRALAVAQLGFPVGEAVFPALIVFGLEGGGWRMLWWLAALVLVLLTPVFVRLTYVALSPAKVSVVQTGDASRQDVLRDPRFFRILPVLLTTPFVITGLFFHQEAIAADKEWQLRLLAAAFVAFAVTQVVSSFVMGWCIDRVGARSLLRFYLVPMGLGCFWIAFNDAASAAWIYLGAMGISAGAGGALSGALWAEMYGTRHLGSIRAMQHALMVVSTATSPLLFGALLDAGVSASALAGGCGVYAVFVGPLLGGSARQEPPAL
ncbi:MAG: MFS transporter [Planctomycetes bacterium]|nr:MFS transporter [Planctomycetota bacterium]